MTLRVRAKVLLRVWSWLHYSKNTAIMCKPRLFFSFHFFFFFFFGGRRGDFNSIMKLCRPLIGFMIKVKYFFLNVVFIYYYKNRVYLLECFAAFI